MVPCSLAPAVSPTSYVQSMAPYCSLPPDAFAPSSLDVPSPWARPEIVSFPGTDYSVTVPPSEPAAVTASHLPQDFYTCVQLMNETGEVRLVPCLPLAYCRDVPPVPSVRPDAAWGEEKKKLTDYQVKNLMKGLKDGGYAERSEASVPLLPVAVDTK